MHRNSLCALVFLALSASPRAQETGAGVTTDFVVLSGGRAVGTESLTVTTSADGWSLSAREDLGPPFNVTTSRFQVRYTPDWQPISLSMEGTRGERLMTLFTTFSGTTARNQGMQQGEPFTTTHQVSPNAVVVAGGLFAAYEGLAARLGSASAGTRIPLYIAPQGEVIATVTRVVPHRLVSPTAAIDLREFDLSFNNPGAPIALEVWIDGRGRLARLAVPASWLVVIRNDISSVMTREETITRPGDREVFVPALGFSLAATVSKPSGAATGKRPAVLLIGAAGPQDRDELVAGIPVFGHIANALADAGYVVVRYDKRGISRSGGRVESATLADYADDALNVVKWLRKRPDIDPKRVAIAGYGEGAAMALLAASREKNIAGVALLGGAGQPGRDVTLYQQEHAMARSTAPDAEKQATIALQRQIVDAVLKNAGWEALTPAMRQRAETPWFKSWLLFDPAAIVRKIKQPVLVLTGALDAQFPPAQADRLEALARERKKLPASAIRKVIVPGVNHLLVAARSGEEDEYAMLSGAVVAPDVTAALTNWLETTLAVRKN